MRKLTAKEINEIADVFKATLEACSSKTAKKPRAAKGVENSRGIDNDRRAECYYVEK